MRVIKFRAWRPSLKRFRFFDLSTGFNTENSDVFPSVDQFTGLLDKEGVEIYEGDIVGGVLYKDYSEHIGKILYDFSGYRIVTKEKSMTLDLPEKLTVIGNIHQNPELLNR